ncbi:MAG TPA: hypothetical protein VNY31_10435 [Solirubrobacteraceae bacterium]|jgi:hypothetical protein|nr:hypothetical protein [Solirubrobacteraceae bacterium]
MASSAADPGDVDEIDYVQESGPGIPELPAGPIQPADLTEDDLATIAQQYPGWDVETVEQFLRGTGSGLHLLIGAGEKDWLMTRADLDRIAPPLTRIMNRYEPTLRVSEYADPLLVAHGLGLYGWRSALQRQAAIRERERTGQLSEDWPDEEPADVEDDAPARTSSNGRPPHVEMGEDYIPYADRRPRK